MNREVIRVFKSIKRECLCNLDTDYDNWRHSCILHKYLLYVNPRLRYFGTNCAGGYICEKLQEILGLKATTDCPTIHRNIYNLIKKNEREIKI